MTKEEEGWEFIIVDGPGNCGLARVSYSRRRRKRRARNVLILLVFIAVLMVVRTVKSALNGMRGLPVVLGR